MTSTETPTESCPSCCSGRRRRAAATSISATMREVAKTGGNSSPGWKFSTLARSWGATVSWAVAVASTASSLIVAPPSSGLWFLVSQNSPQQLSLQCARKLLDELDEPRQLVNGNVVAAIVDDTQFQLFARLIAGLENDEGLHVLAAHRIGNADDAGVGDGGVLQHRILDFLGSDAVAGALDQVFLARHEAEVALIVDGHEVADQHPSLANDRLLLLEHGAAILVRAPVERAGGGACVAPT